MQLEPGQGLVCHLRVSGNQAAFHCLQYSELQDKVTSTETKVLEMETTVEDLQWDIEKLRKREQKLNKHLAEALEQVRERMEPNGELGTLASAPHMLCVCSLCSSTLATMCLGVPRAFREARSHLACRR